MYAVPKNAELNDDQTVLKIAWNDGHVGLHRLDVLRSLCPCAVCTGHHPSESLNLKPEQFTDIRLLDIELVGRYAYRFIWSDNHSTGFYEYRKLRELENSG